MWLWMLCLGFRLNHLLCFYRSHIISSWNSSDNLVRKIPRTRNCSTRSYVVQWTTQDSQLSKICFFFGISYGFLPVMIFRRCCWRNVISHRWAAIWVLRKHSIAFNNIYVGPRYPPIYCSVCHMSTDEDGNEQTRRPPATLASSYIPCQFLHPFGVTYPWILLRVFRLLKDTPPSWWLSTITPREPTSGPY